MDTMQAIAMGQANRGKEMMVFDWDRAAKRILESGAKEARAGLANDWEYTGGTIFQNGEPNTKSWTYLASTWAKPELELDGQKEDCFKMKNEVPKWGPNTKWPESALNILRDRQ